MARAKCPIEAALLIVLLASHAGAQTPRAQTAVPAPAQAPAGAPVVVGGRTVFRVQTSLGPFTAQERAAATSARLTRVARDLTAAVEKISAAKSDTTTDITLGDLVLFTVTDADAKAAGLDRPALADADITNIREAIVGVRLEYSSQSLLKGGASALLITVALIALLILLRKTEAAITARLHPAQTPAIRIQRVELISAGQIKHFLRQAIRATRWLLVLAAFYLYVPLVLSLFPWTREYAPRLVEYILEPLRAAGGAVADYLPKLFVVVICAVGAQVLIRFSHFLFRELGRGTISWPGFYREWADPTHKIVRFLILATTAVVVFPYLPGSGSPAFQGISIFLGVLFSLGSTSAVANIIGGVILTYSRAFQIGDRVKIAETVGDVIEKSLLATRIRTIKNEFITVPNSMVLGSHIINFSSSEEGAPLILHTSVTIGYDAPWRTVHGLLIEAASRTALIVKEPAPFVLQTSLDDFYVTYQINAYTSEPARMAVTYAELHQNIQDCFNEAGVEIMSPHYGSLRDGNLTTIPEEYLPKGYRAPPFRFERQSNEPDRPESK